MNPTEKQIIEALFEDECYDWASINEMRLYNGLPPLKPGLCLCLKCDREFESWDITMNRLCPECVIENRDEAYNSEANFDDRTIYTDDIQEHYMERGLDAWGNTGRVVPKPNAE